MPLYDFKCFICGDTRVDVLVKHRDIPVLCEKGHNMRPLPCAPNFKVTGFNAETGYASPRTFTQDHGNGIKTQVSGNPEAFDNLHP